MNNIIIHISDLHVTDYTSRLNPRDENSILDTNEANRNNVTYIQKICDIIKDIFPKHNKILLITGDISNAGEEDEFVVAEKYIKIFAEELNLNIENILILPGDHDIHRDSVREAMRKNKKKRRLSFSL
ncbi:metallophosphoesterase [Bacteroides thetaiotaomicron]|uniref:metallophosphoesterase n=1 Tax=Bacteroides thetaiotaomicron TaxID=818 RepID=UPI0039C18104